MSVLPRFSVGRRALHVWRRNLDVQLTTWKISLLPPLVEPLLYILAFGVGLGGFVGKVPWGGQSVPYLVFIAPALLAVNAMNNAFFETTFSSFVRMHYQRTFDAMLATPLTIDEVIAGEILWGATRSVISVVLMLAVISPFGLLEWPSALLILPLAFLGGLAFASAGMIFTGVLPTIETFNLPIFLFITPMFLLSGTFFPLEGLPGWARVLAQALPLTHLSELCRAAGLGRWHPDVPARLMYLVAFTAVTAPAALLAMRRRLIR